MWSSPDEKLLSVPDENYFVYGEGQDMIHLRAEYVPGTLQIGEYDDGVYLLNLHIKTPDGEWEAWYLAPWLAGADLRGQRCPRTLTTRPFGSRTKNRRTPHSSSCNGCTISAPLSHMAA